MCTVVRCKPHDGSRNNLRARGFTLLEVLIALAVLALCLSALVSAASGQIRLAERTRERLYAEFVLANALAELRLREPWPQLGPRDGRARLANMEWLWQAQVSATPEADIRRMDLRVSRVSGGTNQAVLSRSAFSGRR